MKTHLLLIGLLFISTLSSGQADVWSPVVTHGFNSPDNFDIVEFEIFKGKLYAATGRKNTDAAELWYSPTGGSGSWTQVTGFTPTLHPAIKSIHSFGKTDSLGGVMWLCTGSGIGTQVYRTTDGFNWNLISKKGFGDPGLVTGAPNMVVFRGPSDTIPYLYAGAGSHGGLTNAKVWRIPYNSTDSMDWVKLIDFDTVATAITDTVDLISYFTVWNHKIYFSTNGKGQLWESTDGVNFTQNPLAPFGSYGFGVPTQIVIANLQVFHDTLFASTTNKILGGQMYRSGDGISWENVTTNAFGKADSAEELHNMDTAFGFIWVTAYTDTSVSRGCPIWRSSDGWNFIQSNIDGFGNPLINGENAVTIGFGNRQYFGGPNYSTGAEIWRTTTLSVHKPSISQISCKTHLYPNPSSAYIVISLDSECNEYGFLKIFNIRGELIHQMAIIDKSAIIHKNNMMPGLYLFTIEGDEGTFSSGEFIIQ